MIIAECFIWLHLPKTGTTSMNQLFRRRYLPGGHVDPDDTPAKHVSVPLRENRGGWRAVMKRRRSPARRLEASQLSGWQHTRHHRNLPDLDFEPVRSCLFYSLRLGGTWVAAYWWLQYLGVDERVTALRLEHLAADLNTHLLPGGTEPFQALPRENARPGSSSSRPSRPEAAPFSAADRARIAACHPRWRAWERRMYGESPAADV